MGRGYYDDHGGSYNSHGDDHSSDYGGGPRLCIMCDVRLLVVLACVRHVVLCWQLEACALLCVARDPQVP